MTAGLSVNSRYEPKNSRRSDTQIPSSLNSYEGACPAWTVSSRPFSRAGRSTSLMVHFHCTPEMAQNRHLRGFLLFRHEEETPEGVCLAGLPRLWAGTMGPRPGVRVRLALFGFGRSKVKKGICLSLECFFC